MNASFILYLVIILSLCASIFFWRYLLSTETKDTTLAHRLLMFACAGLLFERGLTLVFEQPALFSPDSLKVWFAMTIGVVFLLLSHFRKTHVFGAIVAPWMCMSILGYLAFPTSQTIQSTESFLGNAWHPVHLALFILGEVTMIVAAVSAIFYLIQSRRLKEKRIDSLSKIPALRVLETIFNRFWLLATLLFTLAIPAAGVLAKHQWGAYWSWEPKQIWATCVWLSLLSGWQFFKLFSVHGRRRAQWVAYLSVVFSVSYWIVENLTVARHVGDYQ